MAFAHGKKARLYGNGYDLSSYFSKAKIGGQAAVGETSSFGDDDKTYLPGLVESKLHAEGVFDGAVGGVGGIDAVLDAALGGSSFSNWILLPQGDGIGNAGYGLAAVETTLEVDDEVTGVVKTSVEAIGTGSKDRIIVHHALAVEVAGVTGAAQDGGAASSNGGVGYIQVPDITGITGLTVTIEDSADGSSGWATILSFTVVAADNAYERVAIAGNVRRYTRSKAVFTGAGSSQYFVGFGRK